MPDVALDPAGVFPCSEFIQKLTRSQETLTQDELETFHLMLLVSPRICIYYIQFLLGDPIIRNTGIQVLLLSRFYKI